MAHLYLVEPTERLIPGGNVRLHGDEARHAAKAARLRPGEQVLLGDGQGIIARAEASRVDAEAVELVLLTVEHHDPPLPPLWLVQSLAKSGRDEHAIEQATEVGISRVIPLQSERSVVRWENDKAHKGQLRWQKIVTEASKQSLQPWVSEVAPLASLTDVLSLACEVQVIALDHRAEQTLLDVELRDPLGSTPIALMVGPEGGWSEREREVMADAGCVLARLGPGVLRASSAGPIAAALLHARLRHW